MAGMNYCEFSPGTLSLTAAERPTCALGGISSELPPRTAAALSQAMDAWRAAIMTSDARTRTQWHNLHAFLLTMDRGDRALGTRLDGVRP